ncbi:MAG: aldo/keto reductase [Candidatus Acidiferrales bacterium]
MKYRKMGRTDASVSEIAYGLWGMSGWSGSDDRESLESLQMSVNSGCTFFDTAWAYGEGKSDGLLGETMARNRGKRLYAASKIPPKNREWPPPPECKYSEAFPPEHVFDYAHRIREKLRVETIDLLQFHVWDDVWTAEPDFRQTVEELKRRGWIRWFGISLNRWEPENGLAAIETGLVDVVQVIYNIFDQAPEDKLFPLCRKMNIGVIARVPLDEGSLGGKLTPDTKFPASDWRSKYFSSPNLESTLERVEKLKKLLPPGTSLPEMSLRFILSNPAVSTTIIGMRKASHVKENIATSDAGPLDAALLQKLKAHRWDRKPQRWSD